MKYSRWILFSIAVCVMIIFTIVAVSMFDEVMEFFMSMLFRAFD
jgi:hypothetical protein